MIRLLYAIILFSIVSCTSKKFQTKKEVDKNGFTYERVEGDNSKTRIYTLENGLNIYLSINQEEPRIFTQIGVKAGSTYDPKETTGLAHYLEHMLFKGTSKLGALDWDNEKVLLDKIRDLYEEHKLESDEVKKKLIYGKIDSVSQLAAKLVSPNEYDKLMQNIGGSNTNAYTSSERTVYINEIPSNEIERWLTIEKERFSELVLRLFHTELEAVYEEYNMRMKDSDYSKSYKKLFELLYLKHPLGTQTTIGEADHLKNPSWLNIEDYFIKYYVPNNMCIAMSGDFDMDNTIKLINEHFGSFAMKDVPELVLPKEEPINNVRTAEVLGPDEEFISIGFRLGNNESGDEKYGELLSKVLYNGTAGLIDLNLIQKQKVLGAFTWYWQHKDYASHMFFGYAREGQKLDEVKELILGELNKIKEGDFDAALIKSAIADFRKEQMKSNESNYRRCSGMVDAFIQGYDWSDVVSNIDDMSKITKEKLIEFVKKNYHDNNYAIVYKRFGEDTTGISIDKPKITPVPLNRGVESSISKEINEMKASKIEASFLDFNKDIEHLDFNGNTPLKAVKNNINSRFSVTYTFEMGNDHSKDLGVAINVLPLLGTSEYSPEELKKKWYSMGVDMSVRTWGDRSFVSINGIKESMPEAISLLDHVLREVKFDSLTYLNFVKDELKSRENNMKNKYYLFHGAIQMVKYGKLSSFNNEFSESELKALDLGVLTEKVLG
ncbi:MAG TPA: insulinase family protein [Bacteroidetes bacterium]|nr:insulinase family protein [Bacteroidota bacterium]